MKTTKPKLKKSMRYPLLAALLIGVLLLGFMGGQYYSNHRTSKDTSAAGQEQICHCPDIPVNASPADIAKICSC